MINPMFMFLLAKLFHNHIQHYDRSTYPLFITLHWFTTCIDCCVTSVVYFKRKITKLSWWMIFWLFIYFNSYQAWSFLFQRIVFKPISCWNINLKRLKQTIYDGCNFYIHLMVLLAVSLYYWFPLFKYLECIIALMHFMEHCKTLT